MANSSRTSGSSFTSGFHPLRSTIHEKPLATFALVDAAGVKALLQRVQLPTASLQALRTRIDAIAEKYPQLAFVSFADSLPVKQVWFVGHVGSSIRYTCSPGALLPAISELQRAIADVLGLDAYTVVTQGMNACRLISSAYGHSIKPAARRNRAL